uniref:Protein kinase domain-containing protein n=1 Tax=Rhizophagus irregularis (strain DAOM 181602 / DAOM 197198 / MUCL 43194) TaxID=747089 RepID=U9UGB4_RHIID
MSSTNIPPKSVPGYSSTNPFTFTRSPSLPASTSGEKSHTKHSTNISNTNPFGQCEQCKGSKTGYDWCQYCNSEYFRKNFTNWSSENKELDNFIQIAQLKAINVRSVLEWIEYKEFTNVKHLADGGNSSVFTAHWPQGPIRAWDTTANNWKRGWEQVNSDVIILKQIKNSDNMTSDFYELSAYHQFSNLVTHVVRCYGISRCPFTRELIVVTSYARDGDLRQYNSRNFDTFTWEQRIITLKDIAVGLVTIHKAGLLHKDLHTGNILRDGSWTMISDLGLCWNNTSADKNEVQIHGVLPYVAPEVLRKKAYTRAADVYSIGMIMFELWSGRRPFEGREYDAFLAIEICSGSNMSLVIYSHSQFMENLLDKFLYIGIRPKITSNIPDYYSKVMQSCWDNDPDMRPTSRDLEITFNSWIDKITKRELVCPKMPKRESNVSTPISSSVLSENITSQSLPSISVEQHKILEEIDKRREALYQNYLNQQLIERAERESRNKGPLNPMTWTTELKTLADKIFGNQASKDIEIRPIGATDTTSPEENADDDNNEIQIGIKTKWFIIYKFVPC